MSHRMWFCLDGLVLSLKLYASLSMTYVLLQEVEREAPNNAFVIIVFGIVGMVLQVRIYYKLITPSRNANYFLI